MADLVRAVLGDFEKNIGRAYAEAHDLKILDEPTRNADGSLRRTTRRKGRPVKPKTTVNEAAAKKTSASTKPATKAAESAAKSDTTPSKES